MCINLHLPLTLLSLDFYLTLDSLITHEFIYPCFILALLCALPSPHFYLLTCSCFTLSFCQICSSFSPFLSSASFISTFQLHVQVFNDGCPLLGRWVAYSHVDYSGNQYVLEKGFYNNCADWGSGDNRICSIQPILPVRKHTENLSSWFVICSC